jgi:hypothetical protein
MTGKGVKEPCSGRLTTADADLPSLSHAGIVAPAATVSECAESATPTSIPALARTQQAKHAHAESRAFRALREQRRQVATCLSWLQSRTDGPRFNAVPMSCQPQRLRGGARMLLEGARLEYAATKQAIIGLTESAAPHAARNGCESRSWPRARFRRRCSSGSR